MAKQLKTSAQQYPRINDEQHTFYGFLDESRLKSHLIPPSKDKIKSIIRKAIIEANRKSSRAILDSIISDNDEELQKQYSKIGIGLFKYFIKYCGDPASTAHDCMKKHYSLIAQEQFRNRTLQKERMNSGWRYQFIAKDTAMETGRFKSVSDIGASEADFNVIVETIENSNVSIYVSVKNRTNTMGGQDWPKAIRAMEDMAKSDKNRTGPYLCVFGIAMDKGKRTIKCEAKTKQPYSMNTEVWLSDFFWPFFSNITYNDLIRTVLEVLMEEDTSIDKISFEIPNTVIESFGDECKKLKLLDSNGCFNDPYKLVDLFCGQNG